MRHEARVRYRGGVDMAGCDEATLRAIAAAEGSLAAMAREDGDDERPDWEHLLSDARSLDALLAENAWVRRNSRR